MYKRQMSVLEDGGVEDITLLHCNTEYPTPFAAANLRAMQDLASPFGCAVGYSDHTLGWEPDIAAVINCASRSANILPEAVRMLRPGGAFIMWYITGVWRTRWARACPALPQRRHSSSAAAFPPCIFW